MVKNTQIPEIPKIPNAKLLPHMIEDHEVPALILNDERAEESLRRRLDAKNDRKQRRKDTRFILTAAGVSAAGVVLGVEAVNYNREHAPAQSPQPIEQSGVATTLASNEDATSYRVTSSGKELGTMIVPKSSEK